MVDECAFGFSIRHLVLCDARLIAISSPGMRQAPLRSLVDTF